MNSKGQVSIFIILGVVLLLLTVVFLSTGNLSEKQKTYDVTEKVDEQFIAAQKFVQNCLDTTSRQGLEILGSQGGYIDPVVSGLVVNYPSSKQPATAFKFIEGSNVVVPYWYYLSSKLDCSGDCAFDSKAPDLDGPNPNSIQSQLQTYVNDNLYSCLDGFSSLSDAGYVVEATTEPQTTVLIRENDVRFYLSYPITVSRGETKQEITQYVADQDVALKALYNYATLITAAQIRYNFLERHTVSMISLNSGPNINLLPPSSATTYDYVSTIFWLKSRVKQQLQQILTAYIPGLQVMNSKNFEPRTYDQVGVSNYGHAAIQRVYDNMVIPINNSDANDDLKVNNRFDVNFVYNDWPIYLDVNSDGEIIRPHSLTVSDLMIGLQQFDTYYDITYPVRVVLSDSKAFKQSGYEFAFGLQGNIRGSAPLNDSYTLFTGSSAGGTFVCNRDQFNTGDSQVKVVDNKTGLPISDVSLTFTCGSETCTIGSTNENGNWAGKLPICGGAMLTFAKDESYSQRAVQLSTNLDESVDVGTVSLKPFRILNASVGKKLVSKSALTKEWVYSSTATSLSPKEFAIVSYKQVGEEFGTDPVQGAFMYYGALGTTEDTTVKVVPGLYEVTVQTILNEPLVIDKEERTIKILGGLKKIKFTIPAIRMDQFPSGVLTLNETTGYWYVNESDVDEGNDAVTFYALGPVKADIKKSEDLQILNKLDGLVAQNYQTLKPAYGSSDALSVPEPGSDNSMIFLQLLTGYLTPGETAEYGITVTGGHEIKTVEVMQPMSSSKTQLVGLTARAKIPTDAYGPTPVVFKFTLDNNVEVTVPMSVDVHSVSNLSDVSVDVIGSPRAPSYTFSNATVRGGASLKVTANFEDGTSHVVTDNSNTRFESDDPSIIDFGEEGKLLFYNLGQTIVNVTFTDKSTTKFLEIPITITQ